VIEEPEEDQEEKTPKTINFMDVLKRSVEASKGRRRTTANKATKKKAGTRKRATKRKRAS
jgi:non-homologous end joining protein Ku